MKIFSGAARIQSGNAPTADPAPNERSNGCATAGRDSERMAP